MNFAKIYLSILFLLLAPALVFAQSLPELTWSEDGKRFLYRSDGKFFWVDVEQKEKNPVFEKTEWLLKATTHDVEFGDSSDELILNTGQRFCKLDLSTRKIERLEERPEDSFQPRQLSLPPKPSLLDGPDTIMRVVNRSDQPIQILWFDNWHREYPYKTIQPGKSFRQYTYVGHSWLLKSEEGRRLGSFRVGPAETIVVDQEMLDNVKRDAWTKNPGRMKWGKPSPSTRSPDGKWRAKVRGHNLYLNNKKLTSDYNPRHTFENVGARTEWYPKSRGLDVRWSPDSKVLAAFQTVKPDEPKLEFMESTPKGQLKPKLHGRTYARPGDKLPTKTLRLFSAADGKEIPLSDELFENQWLLKFVCWVDGGKKFWLHYNQRGHQVVRLIEVESATGKARTLIEETSDTFIHYSTPEKSTFEPLSKDHILWASERSGWNHLYRFDSKSGDLVNAVTEGEWNVKRIDKIDYERKLIWFYAVGIREDEDPYHEHFCRVKFDGTGLRVLSNGDGTHKVSFERDEKFLLDSWSRVDLAQVTALRDAETGELIVELDRLDTKKEFGSRPLSTRFHAKGRDGETDIWGVIDWPRNFDPEKSYPVIEHIYAGPHDHHVHKTFRKYDSRRHNIADAGFIVVQIDGMGTAWRSKKFHDVCYKNLKDGGFPDRIAWIKAAAKEHPQMDLERVGIFGGSAGGQNAMAALLWHNEFYKVAVADCGCHDNRMDKVWWNEQFMGWPVDESYVENSNMENAHLLKGHLMLTVGELDDNVDPATTLQVVKKLIEADKDFEFVLIPGEGHGAGDKPWAAKKRLNFFKKHLLGED